MTLDPAVAQLIEGLAQQGLPTFEQLGVNATRAVFDDFVRMQKPPQDVRTAVTLPYGPDEQQVLRILVPNATPSLPVVVFLHGGGFVAGSLTAFDEPARAVANAVGAIVVLVGYRRAPEAKFPAASDDAVAALNWVVRHIAEHGGDPQRLALMGDSSGGNLASVAALRARDSGGPALAGLVLVYPFIDPRADTVSRRELATGYLQSTSDLEWFADQYLSSPEDGSNPYVAVNRWDSYSGFPRTLIVTVEYDPLRDEAESFACQLHDAGVDVDLRRLDGLVHGTLALSGAVPRQAEIIDAVAGFLRKVL